MIKIDIKKRLAKDLLLKVNRVIQKGDFLALFGESGAGKTTLLRILSGLERPDEGKIVVEGEVWFDSQTGFNMPVQKRKIGFVFQDYTLFPNMSVYENLLFAKNDRQKADFLLKLIELDKLKDRYPHQLSGGQKQRVALIRALMREPKILFLDEPLSALDVKMRSKLQDELAQIHKRLGVTTILVSHEISEIFKLCNKVFVLEKGEIKKEASPFEIFVEAKVASSFKFDATILDLKEEDFLCVLTLSFGSNIIKSVIPKEEAKELKIGDKVLVSSKAFNPIIQKIEF